VEVVQGNGPTSTSNAKNQDKILIIVVLITTLLLYCSYCDLFLFLLGWNLRRRQRLIFFKSSFK
jgi:hypothetical protein